MVWHLIYDCTEPQNVMILCGFQKCPIVIAICINKLTRQIFKVFHIWFYSFLSHQFIFFLFNMRIIFVTKKRVEMTIKMNSFLRRTERKKERVHQVLNFPQDMIWGKIKAWIWFIMKKRTDQENIMRISSCSLTRFVQTKSSSWEHLDFRFHHNLHTFLRG